MMECYLTLYTLYSYDGSVFNRFFLFLCKILLNNKGVFQMKQYNVGIIGATGMVCSDLLR